MIHFGNFYAVKWKRNPLKQFCYHDVPTFRNRVSLYVGRGTCSRRPSRRGGFHIRPQNHKKQYSAKVNNAVFLSSGLSPAISSSRSTTIRSPVSKSLGISLRRNPPTLPPAGGIYTGGGFGGSGAGGGLLLFGAGRGASSARLRL